MARVFLNANWEHIIMANYAIDSDVLKPYLPKGVVVDTFNNNAYVSLVGFLFKNTSIFNVPIPFFGDFEEINLRFYVKRIDSNIEKRGVVFINETVPYKIVAWLANKLYKEHYIAIPTRHTIKKNDIHQTIQLDWKNKGDWNSLRVSAKNAPEDMKVSSMEEFIFEHYYGYVKVSDNVSQEYQVIHPSWQIHQVLDYRIHCDFQNMYGKNFSFLNNCKPESVFLAKGSPISINWKRNTF